MNELRRSIHGLLEMLVVAPVGAADMRELLRSSETLSYWSFVLQQLRRANAACGRALTAHQSVLSLFTSMIHLATALCSAFFSMVSLRELSVTTYHSPICAILFGVPKIIGLQSRSERLREVELVFFAPLPSRWQFWSRSTGAPRVELRHRSPE